MTYTYEQVIGMLDAFKRRGYFGENARLEELIKSDMPDAVECKANRWDAFSDEEVRDLVAGVADRWNDPALPSELIERAGVLAQELMTEDRRRLGGYQGPGIYEAPDHSEIKVFGTVAPSGIEYVIYQNNNPRFSRPELGLLCSTMLVDFNEPLEGEPRYRYLRPLGESS